MICEHYFADCDMAVLDLTAWSDILPLEYRILAINLFADVFVADSHGHIHKLETSHGKIRRIANSEADFQNRCSDVNSEESGDWLLKKLVDQCRDCGLVPRSGQCYAFTILPILGGEYDVENIYVGSFNERINFLSYMYCQLKDLPDGTQVSIEIVD